MGDIDAGKLAGLPVLFEASGRNAKDFATETMEVNKNTRITMKLYMGGGYVARLVKE